MAATFGAAFASTMGMVDRVHGSSPLIRTPTQPAVSTRLANFYVRVVGVAHLADGGPAIRMHDAHFTGRKLNLGLGAFAGH